MGLNLSGNQSMTSHRLNNPLVSIIIPVYNEEESIKRFVETTRKELEGAKISFEMVFINDGSNDETLDRLLEQAKSDPRVRIINLSRNFGKESALSAGIENATGDVLVPIDVDMQDPPELIPRFLELWKQGYDIVYGARSSRKSDTYSKRTTATWFYRVFNKLSTLKIPEDAGDFRLIDKRVATVLKQIPERNRFMKGLFSWVGFSSIGVPYERPLRAEGQTKWNHWKLWNYALDGLISFSTLPLRIWTYIGAGIAALSFTYGSFIVIRTLLLGVDLPGYASLLTTILFLGGIQILSIGILGEYLGRIFIEVKNRPLFVIESTYPPTEKPNTSGN